MSHKKKIGDLDFSTLIQSQAKDGRLLFNGRRAIIFNTAAMGALRQQLIETLSTKYAMGILSRFGYNHGYNDAKQLSENFDWETEDDWLAAGSFIQMLEGLVHVTPQEIEFDRGTNYFYMRGIWHNSYEAEEHLKRYGLSKTPVCWSLAGYASGYASAFFGRELLAIETECVGKGDERCCWEIRSIDEWGADSRIIPYFQALESINLAGLYTDTNRRLQESEARFRDVALSSADWIWEVDTDGRYIYCSERVKDVLGYTVEEMLGKTPFDLMPPDEAARVGLIFAEIVANQQPVVDLESWGIGKDGRAVCLLTNGVPRFDGRGNFIGYRGVGKDISERKRAEEELGKIQRLLQGIMDHTTVVIYIKGLTGRYLLVNRRYEELFGVKQENIVGKTAHDIFARELAEEYWRSDLAVIEADAPLEQIEKAVLKDGTHTYLSFKFPIYDDSGSPYAVCGIATDITEREMSKTERERLLAELEDQARQLQVTLAETSNLYLASHDINTATTPGEVLQALLQGIELPAVNRASINLFDRPWVLHDIPKHISMIAAWDELAESGNPIFVTGARLRLNKYSAAQLLRPDDPLIIDDVSTHPDLDEATRSLHLDTFQARSAVYLPLTAGGQWIGIFNVMMSEVIKLDDTRLRRLMTLVEQAAAAIQNQRLLEQTHATLDKTETLYAISSSLNAASGESEILQALAQPALASGAAKASLMYLDLDETGTPEWAEVVATWHREGVPSDPPGTRYYLPEMPFAHLWTSTPNKVLFVSDITTDERVDENVSAEMVLADSRAISVVPLTRAGRRVGVTVFGWSEAREFSEQERELYHALIGLGSPAVADRRSYMAGEVAREETERLFQVSRGLNRARDENDLLQVMVQPAVEAGAVSANLIYLELDETDTPMWAEIAAAWSRKDTKDKVTPPAPVGMRYYLPEFPLVNLWLSNPHKPLLVADVDTNDELSARIKAAMAESGNRAMVIIPLTQTGRWVGLVIFNWNKPHEFGKHETEIYRALAGLGTPAVAGRRLFAQTQTRARRQQSLREITATISASEDMSDLIAKLPDIVEPLRQLVPVDLLSAVTHTPGDLEFTYFAVVSETESDSFVRPGTRMPVRGTGVGWVVTHQEPWLEANLRQRKTFGEDEQLLAQGILSRLILPLQLGGQIVGVLDLGSRQPDAFSREHIPILNQVAGQIAQALERTRLMESTRAALAEAAATHRSYLRREWQDYLQKEQTLRRNAIVYDQEQASAVPGFWRPEIERALAQGDLVAVETQDAENPQAEHETRTGLVIPIVVRGQTLGVLGVEDPSGERRWSAEEISLVQAIGQQLGQALDNARLIEATQRRAAQEQLTSQVTARMRETLDVETVLETAAREIGQALGLATFDVRLGTENEH